MKHELKTWPEYFQAVYDGTKTFEVRKNDRNYQVGDRLILREWDPFRESYTGANADLDITYVLNDPNFCKEGYVIMGIKFGYGGLTYETHNQRQTRSSGQNDTT